MTSSRGTLFLLPNVFDEKQSHKEFLPSQLENIVLGLDGLIAESEKSARRFLLAFLDRKKFDSFPVKMLNEHTTSQELNSLLDPIYKGQRWGLISDAGIPCIADPGSRLVYLAHKRNLLVEALYGPSSIFLSLMLSGLYGQKFAFQGYLPRKKEVLKKEISKLEQISSKENMTQICIEAPYRSNQMVSALLEQLKPDTKLCVASELMLPSQKVKTMLVKKWKEESFDYHKKRCVFLFQAK